MGRCRKEFMKAKSHFIHGFSQELLVSMAQVKDTQIAESIFHVFQYLMGLGLVKDKFKPFPSEFLDHLHKGIGGKGIMLGGDAEALFLGLV